MLRSVPGGMQKAGRPRKRRRTATRWKSLFTRKTATSLHTCWKKVTLSGTAVVYPASRMTYIRTCEEGYRNFEFDLKYLDRAYTRSTKED